MLCRILLGMPVGAIAMSSCVAPRVEIYTQLVCKSQKPDYTSGDSTSSLIDSVFSYRNSVYSISNDTSNNPVLSLFPDQNDDLPASNYYAKQDDNDCASDPEVQAEVAKLIASLFFPLT